jgi:hypothetical protein
VTPKGRTGNRRDRERASLLLYGLFGLSAVTLGWYFLTLAGWTGFTYRVPWAAHAAALWLTVNAGVVALAIRRVMQSRYAAERRSSVRFETRLAGTVNDRPCVIEDLSLTGARVRLHGLHIISNPATLVVNLGGREIELSVHVRATLSGPVDRTTTYGLEFAGGQLVQCSALALALFNALAGSGLSEKHRSEIAAA